MAVGIKQMIAILKSVVYGSFSVSLLNMEPDFDGSDLKGIFEWACSFSGCCLYF